MGKIMSDVALRGAVELGLVYGLVAVGLFLSYRILNSGGFDGGRKLHPGSGFLYHADGGGDAPGWEFWRRC